MDYYEKYIKYKSKYTSAINKNNVQTGGHTKLEEFSSLDEVKKAFHSQISESINTYAAASSEVADGILKYKETLSNTWEFFTLAKRLSDGKYIYESSQGAGAAGVGVEFEKVINRKIIYRSPRKFRYVYNNPFFHAKHIGNYLLDILDDVDASGDPIVLSGKVWRGAMKEGQCGKQFDFYINSKDSVNLHRLFNISKIILENLSHVKDITPISYCNMNFPMTFTDLVPEKYTEKYGTSNKKDILAYTKNYANCKLEFILLNVNGLLMTYRNDHVDVVRAMNGIVCDTDMLFKIIKRHPMLSSYYNMINNMDGVIDITRDYMLNGPYMEKLIYETLYRDSHVDNYDHIPMVDLLVPV